MFECEVDAGVRWTVLGVLTTLPEGKLCSDSYDIRVTTVVSRGGT